MAEHRSESDSLMMRNGFVRHQGELPERRFVAYRDPGGPEAVWRRVSCESLPPVTVIIPTADAYRNGLFYKLLLQLTVPDLDHIEIIVIVGDKRQGRAINIGAALSSAEFILTLDDDTRLYGTAWLDRLLAVMRQSPAIGMAGGINCIPQDADAFVNRAMQQLPRRVSPPVAEVVDSDLAEHPLLLMRRADFEAVGGEHEMLPRGLDPYLRDCFRKYSRRVVVVPGAYYSHIPPETPLRLIKQFFRNGWYSAYCQRYFPQWKIETPADHKDRFRRKRPMAYRLARHYIAWLNRLAQGHWIYLMAYTAYGLGFIWAVAKPMKNRSTRGQPTK